MLAAGLTLAASSLATASALADDTVGPVATSLDARAISNGDPGFVKQGGQRFYVCANVQDPAGVKSVKMDVSSIGGPSGFYDISNKSMYNSDTFTSYCVPDPVTYWEFTWEGDWVTKSTLAEGVYPYTITMTDNLDNTSTQSANVTVDNTAPKATDVQTTNGGATVGKPEQNDKVTFSHSEMLNRFVASESPRPVVVRIDNSGSSDVLKVYDSFNRNPDYYIGSVKLNGDYVSTNRTFGATGTKSMLVRNGSNVELTLGTASGTTNKVTANKTMVYSPLTLGTDPACNHLLATSATESGAGDPDF
jgi:hypothetical protein